MVLRRWGYVLIGLLMLAPRVIFAVPNESDFGFPLAGSLNLPTGDDPVTEVVIPIIKWILGLLGLIAVIMIIYGGYLWLMAGGNEDQVTNAKKTIRAAVIGIAIVLLAYSISILVFNVITNASGAGY